MTTENTDKGQTHTEADSQWHCALGDGSAFERWWHDEGSGMPPKPDEDAEAHVRRITEIAWSNGAYLEQLKTEKYAEELQQIAEALGMPFSSGRALVERVREQGAALARLDALYRGEMDDPPERPSWLSSLLPNTIAEPRAQRK